MEMMIMPGRVLRNNQVCKDEDHGVAGENPVSAVNMLTDIMVTRYIVKRWTDRRIGWITALWGYPL